MSPVIPAAVPETAGGGPPSALRSQAPAPGPTAAPGGASDGSAAAPNEPGGQGLPAEPGGEGLPAGPGDALDDGRVARWLASHPEFFDDHAELLAGVRLRHGRHGKTVSLIERQVAVLRERNQALEVRMDGLIRIGQENDALNARLQRLARELLRTADPRRLPDVLEAGLQVTFTVPQVAVRLWAAVPSAAGGTAADGTDAGGAAADGSAVAPVPAALRRAIDALRLPYCGPKAFAEAVAWLPGEGADTASIALFALRVGARPESFGVVVLGSPDAGRFQAGMGTAFLEQLAELASAALSRLPAATA